MSETTEKLLSTAEVSHIIWLNWPHIPHHENSIRRWIRDGQLRATMVGRKWYVTMPDLEAFVRSQTKGGPDES